LYRIPIVIIAVILCLFSTSLLQAAPILKISDISEQPDTFSPNGDKLNDTVKISSRIQMSGFGASFKLLAWTLTVRNSRGKTVKSFSHKQKVRDNTRITVSEIWNGKNSANNLVPDGKYYYTFTAEILRIKAIPQGGDVTVKTSPVLSVSVSPDIWDLGTVDPNNTITMKAADTITVLNDGVGKNTYSLCLINPLGWTASQSAAGKNIYILNAAFSTKIKRIIWKEKNLALSVNLVRSTFTKFSGDQTGVKVLPDITRTLWLQFKSPKSTSISEEQNIKVIINAETP